MENYSIMDLMKNGDGIRKEFILNHTNDINEGTKEFCQYALQTFINQLKGSMDKLILFKEFECAIKEDRILDDVRKVCIDTKNDTYLLVSINKITKILDMYGIKKESERRSGKLNSLYLSFSISRTDLLSLISSTSKIKKKTSINSLVK